MQEVILAKYGEIFLKGQNKSRFEAVLRGNMRRRLAKYGNFRIRYAQSTLTIEPQDDSCDIGGAFEAMKKVFGLISLSRALVLPKDLEAVKAAAPAYLADTFAHAKSFKVDARRSDKSFPLNSIEIMQQFGGFLAEAFPNVPVDVHNPDVTIVVEIRDWAAYLHSGRMPGAGGMPVGSGGKAMLLLSGGIDSPVAGCMTAKRGVIIDALHFQSPPYTSERAYLKVCELAKRMTDYCGRISLGSVPFTAVQEAIRDRVPEDYFTLIMRRAMMRIASRTAEARSCEALITGESIGQVASQTLPALAATDDAAGIPVLRPCIALDKEEIVQISRKINTYDISIEPYEDCCTVFTPRHPCTRPALATVRRLEEEAGLTDLLEEAYAGITWTSAT